MFKSEGYCSLYLGSSGRSKILINFKVHRYVLQLSEPFSFYAEWVAQKVVKDYLPRWVFPRFEPVQEPTYNLGTFTRNFSSK